MLSNDGLENHQITRYNNLATSIEFIMNLTQPIKIDTNEIFSQLPNAPIVEAAIHWQTESSKELNYQELVSGLKKDLPNYSEPQKQHKITMNSELGSDGSATHFQSSNWLGVRFESSDQQFVAQFRKNGFVFSHLKPYTSWEEFEPKAINLWEVYKKHFEPTEVMRIGVRYINRVEPVEISNVEDILSLPPRYPGLLKLPLSKFMQHYVFDIPGHDYQVQIVQTLQPGTSPEINKAGLILDIDVFTTVSNHVPVNDLKTKLSEMRWLKNTLFRECLNKDFFEQFKEGK